MLAGYLAEIPTFSGNSSSLPIDEWLNKFEAPWVSLIPGELLECVVTKKHKHSVLKCVKWGNSDFFLEKVR